MISAPDENERTVTRIVEKLIYADKRIAEIKKIYCDGCDNYGGAKCLGCWVDDAMCLIDDAPTVDAVEVVHAEWRIDGFCTNCHYRADVQSIGFNCTGGTRIEYKRTKFCPECGAKMDLEV